LSHYGVTVAMSAAPSIEAYEYGKRHLNGPEYTRKKTIPELKINSMK